MIQIIKLSITQPTSTKKYQEKQTPNNTVFKKQKYYQNKKNTDINNSSINFNDQICFQKTYLESQTNKFNNQHIQYVKPFIARRINIKRYSSSGKRNQTMNQQYIPIHHQQITQSRINNLQNYGDIKNNHHRQSIKREKGNKSISQINPYTKKEYLHFQKKQQSKYLKAVQEVRRTSQLQNIMKPCQIKPVSLSERNKQKTVVSVSRPGSVLTKKRENTSIRKRIMSFRENPQNKIDLKPWDVEWQQDNDHDHNYFL